MFRGFSKKTIPQKISRILFAGLIILFFAAGCADSPGINAPPENTGGVITHAEHIVFIGLDGWGGAYVPKASMPTVKRMIADGASSLDVRCIMPSVSWPNWSTLFFGATPEQRTGSGQRNPPENIVDDFPSVFTLVKNSGKAGRNGPVLFYEWDGLQKICTPETAEKIEIKSDNESAQKIAAYIIKNKPFFTAVVFDQPDGTGHGKGWGSAAYYAKLAELDNYIAIIEQAVKTAGMYDSTVFILSADHGGMFRGHGHNILKQRKIPLVVYGGGIKVGYRIPSPLSICDIAPTMAAIMGLEAPPQWSGRTLKEIFK